MNKFIIAVIIILIIIVIAVVFINSIMKKQNEQVRNLEFSNIDMNMVEDGTYEGETDTELVKAKVKVTVENHKIKNIDILHHDNGKGKPAEVIVDTMVEENTYAVDAVSGATISSSVIKNAVYRALMKGVMGNE